MDISNVAEFARSVSENVSRVIGGKESAIKLVLCAMLARGHILLEDVPGTGKTVMAKSLARSLDAGFSRIQFTPDLLPTDVTGLSVWTRRLASSRSSPVRCSPIYCWPTRSTAPRRARSRRCWSAWRSGR